MVTSGIVVQLDPGAPACFSTREAIRATPAFTVGVEREAGLSVALEACDAAESERWLDWLRRLPGVARAEVVFVHWEDAEVTSA